MLQPSAQRTLAQRLCAGLLGSLLATLPALIWAAESLPASVRACTAETDRDRRLACFDREVARFPDPGARKAAKIQSSTPSTTHGGAPNANVAPASAVAANSTPASATPAATPVKTPTAADKNEPAGKAGHVAARVASIDHVPNEMVLHLDNGQVWQQLQAVPGDLSLKAGDSVTIDKRFGSYWLTGPHVSGMKVRQN
jgi:hypothetical protein